MTALYLFTYVSILFFFLLIIGKMIKYSSMPIHLRWELYPVAHEGKKAEYGGSYYEDSKFWEKEREKSKFLEMKEMLEEIVFLKGVFIHNRPLWYFSFPFHFGLYMLIAVLVFIVFGAIAIMAGTSVAAEGTSLIGMAIYYLTIITGYSGVILTVFGSLGLFMKRLTDKNLRLYNSPIEYVNLLFICLVAVSLLFNDVRTDFSINRSYIAGLFTFDTTLNYPTMYVAHVIISAALFIYLPLTRMTHFVAKYFLYHNVKWDDELNVKGSKLQKRIIEALNYGVSWSAPHMKTGKTWAEVATNLPEEANNEKK
ncbi:respiratory nitrate reductase subunit gamma [candidate division KSB1 bacterium]